MTYVLLPGAGGESWYWLPEAVIGEALARGEPRQSSTPFREPWPLDAWPDVPTRVIACRHDRIFPLECMRRLAAERLGLGVDVIDTGHLPALSAPDELVQLLEGQRVPDAALAS